jgi:hypothetical protein
MEAIPVNASAVVHHHRLGFSMTLDWLRAMAIVMLALVLAVGFQVLRHWARRSGWVD